MIGFLYLMEQLRSNFLENYFSIVPTTSSTGPIRSPSKFWKEFPRIFLLGVKTYGQTPSLFELAMNREPTPGLLEIFPMPAQTPACLYEPNPCPLKVVIL